MRKFLLALVLVALSVSICCAWVTNDDYYAQYIEPKLDKICLDVLTKASAVISNNKPVLEVQLTREERYFSKDTMEFLGEERPKAQYSGVVWRGVWVKGKTIISGWAKADRVYHVNYVYTLDKHLVFTGSIRVGAETSVLEKFFKARLHNISAEYGSLGHLQEVFGGDDVLALGLLIEYDNNTITSVMAINDYVYNDSVPLVPSCPKIDNFIKSKLDELKFSYEVAPPVYDLQK